jgi:hypothetical protein
MYYVINWLCAWILKIQRSQFKYTRQSGIVTVTTKARTIRNPIDDGSENSFHRNPSRYKYIWNNAYFEIKQQLIGNMLIWYNRKSKGWFFTIWRKLFSLPSSIGFRIVLALVVTVLLRVYGGVVSRSSTCLKIFWSGYTTFVLSLSPQLTLKIQIYDLIWLMLSSVVLFSSVT